ncbi:unnamed protein product [Discosporangium mesarthrocarpum]
MPRGRKPIRTRSVDKIEGTADNQIECCKARLVAKGFSQRPGIDFFESFSPIAGFDTIRTVLASVVFQGWEVVRNIVNTMMSNVR